jgi:hypothetical protein
LFKAAAAFPLILRLGSSRLIPLSLSLSLSLSLVLGLLLFWTANRRGEEKEKWGLGAVVHKGEQNRQESTSSVIQDHKNLQFLSWSMESDSELAKSRCNILTYNTLNFKCIQLVVFDFLIYIFRIIIFGLTRLYNQNILVCYLEHLHRC